MIVGYCYFSCEGDWKAPKQNACVNMWNFLCRWVHPGGQWSGYGYGRQGEPGLTCRQWADLLPFLLGLDNEKSRKCGSTLDSTITTKKPFSFLYGQINSALKWLPKCWRKRWLPQKIILKKSEGGELENTFPVKLQVSWGLPSPPPQHLLATYAHLTPSPQEKKCWIWIRNTFKS